MITLLLGGWVGGFFVSMCWSMFESMTLGLNPDPLQHITSTAIWPIVMIWLVVRLIRG